MKRFFGLEFSILGCFSARLTNSILESFTESVSSLEREEIISITYSVSSSSPPRFPISFSSSVFWPFTLPSLLPAMCPVFPFTHQQNDCLTVLLSLGLFSSLFSLWSGLSGRLVVTSRNLSALSFSPLFLSIVCSVWSTQYVTVFVFHLNFICMLALLLSNVLVALAVMVVMGDRWWKVSTFHGRQFSGSGVLHCTNTGAKHLK